MIEQENVAVNITAYAFGDKKASEIGDKCGYIEMEKFIITTYLRKVNLINFPDGEKLVQNGSNMVIKITDKNELTNCNLPIRSAYPTEYGIVIDNMNTKSTLFALTPDEYNRIKELFAVKE